MNALVSIDVATLTPATVFAPGGVEAILSKIEADVSAEVFTLETEEGRERIKAVAYKVARSKTALDDMGKELVSGIKAQAATIDAERRIIRDRLDALKATVRGPLTAWETAEAARVANHETVLVWVVQAWQIFDGTAEAIRQRIDALDNEVNRTWDEFAERAGEAHQASRTKLFDMLTAAEQAERDAAELAELRQLKAERDERDRKAAEQAAAAEQARLIEEAKAARLAQEAEQAAAAALIRANEDARRAVDTAARIEREKIEAAARAVEQERERAARAKADEDRAAAKREANKKHRAKIQADITVAVLDLIMGQENAAAGNLASVIADGIAAGKIPHVSITY